MTTSFNEYQQIRTIEDLIGDDYELLEALPWGAMAGAAMQGARKLGPMAMGAIKKHGPGMAKQAVAAGGQHLANKVAQQGQQGGGMVHQMAQQAVSSGVADQLIAAIQQLKMAQQAGPQMAQQSPGAPQVAA